MKKVRLEMLKLLWLGFHEKSEIGEVDYFGWDFMKRVRLERLKLLWLGLHEKSEVGDVEVTLVEIS